MKADKISNFQKIENYKTIMFLSGQTPTQIEDLLRGK
jgi:hypothetical protein